MDRGNVGEAIKQNHGIGLDYFTKPVNGKLDLDSVQKMFLKGMSSFSITDSNIVKIYRCSSTSMQARLELFQKQVEITKKYHGDANVRYAWLASSKGELPTMMEYGLGHCGLSPSQCTYGIGVHLAAVTCPYTSARYCDVDENGARHLVLCRVVMGNMELLHRGTCQFHPSSSEYDNGVDDIHCPKYYVVWNMNINTHIYPDFVVSFKVALDFEAHVSGNKNINVYGVNNHRPYDLYRSDSSTVDTGKATSMIASTRESPKIPWIPFDILLDTIKNKVTSEKMALINVLYEQFRSKKISREYLVMKLRLIVGDALLRKTFSDFQSKVADIW